MAKCLRCGAGSEWIQGKVPKELPKEPLPEPEGMDDYKEKYEALKKVYDAFTNPDTASVDGIYKLTTEIIEGRKRIKELEALDKANTEKESQIVSLQNRIDFQVEANDILYADQKKELKNVIAGKIALQSEIERLKADNEAQLEAGRNIAKAHLECMAERNVLRDKLDRIIYEVKCFDIVGEMPTVVIQKSHIRLIVKEAEAIIEQSKGKE